MACTPGGTTTPHLSLCKPATGETNWGSVVDANMDTIDNLFNATPALLATKGGTGLATSGTDTSKALFSDGAGGFVMASASSSLQGNGAGTSVPAASVVYLAPGGNINAAGVFNTSEGTMQFPLPNAATLTKFYLRMSSAGTAGTQTVFTVRKNSVTTNMILAIANGAGATTYSIVTGNSIFAAGDLLSIHVANSDGANPSGGIAGFSLA